MGNKLGMKCGHHHHDGHGHHSRHLGECAAKKDGETCTLPREGRCIPTGECPVFKGATVCKPWDSHPPNFVTRACEGKQHGDTCWMSLMPGTCQKMKYENLLTCKGKLFEWWNAKQEDEEVMPVPTQMPLSQ